MGKKVVLGVLVILLGIFFVLDISVGSIRIPIGTTLDVLLGDVEVKETWRYIILNYRLPKAIVAVLVGVALSISGLLMQTLFRNPMAESYVLGISSGASLGVAILILGSSLLPTAFVALFTSSYGIALISVLGSLGLLFLVLLVSNTVRNTVTVLIVGLMFGSFANAIVSILTYFSSAEQLKRFAFWSLGSLGNLSWDVILLFGVVVFIGVFGSLLLIRSLDAMLLGDNYASSMGVNVKKARNLIILVTSLLAGVSTAFVGPIAFIGLAVPHIARLLLKVSSHRYLIISTALLGGVIMLICDMLTQIKGEQFLLPINAVTSIFGAPIVIWLILRRKV
ncbi:iron ABC transporter permease [Myroides marinus]|uniref:FecCD family ABC transporter permease n=1 Tax=Myroides marinus TaxID=703342 RepID=UPI002574E0EB|nr:iron ABC transporter permease [Myroides marinus]MDM1354217.1 iron ABC transporter permease [Myroides marinus]MDM1361541.1 iron ABC transporter permease [Myroides marinus]MDM1373325.1 iron ABC transporter permease [Myroides marinus]MDM1391346.1 iron ABC transporter permease [Myroides marinus]MDM1405455.1 iron ABC transporter permease [Myroides marinus]